MTELRKSHIAQNKQNQTPTTTPPPPKHNAFEKTKKFVRERRQEGIILVGERGKGNRQNTGKRDLGTLNDAEGKSQNLNQTAGGKGEYWGKEGDGRFVANDRSLRSHPLNKGM